jgi:hypothetical protein
LCLIDAKKVRALSTFLSQVKSIRNVEIVIAFCRYFKCEVADLIYIDWGEEDREGQG